MKREYVLSVSYGNYLIQHGGTDKVIREHRDLMKSHGIEYVFLFPISNSVSILGKTISVKLWGMNIGSQFINVYDIEGIISELGDLNCKGWVCKAIFVHHLWRIVIPELKQILNSYSSMIYIYLHDLYMTCNNDDNILQNCDKYCGFGLSSTECETNCANWKLAVRARKTFQSLVNAYGGRLICIAPSHCVKKIYETAFPYMKDQIIVVPHQKRVGEYNRKVEHRKLRVAYVGAQNKLKGWPVFKKLVIEGGIHENYEFYYLGCGEEFLDGVKKIEVSVQKDGQDAMLNALRLNEIDVALLLSGWPETYSYTYYESYAAGCCVVTFDVSGNIADMTRQNGNGYVLHGEEELYKLLQNPEELRKHIRNYKGSFPIRLLQNDEVYSMIKDNDSVCYIQQRKKCGKKKLWNAVYKYINRRKLNAIKTNK